MKEFRLLSEKLLCSATHFSRERQSHPFTIVDLMRMNRHQERQLRRQVRKASGHVEVLIHPFFEEDNPDAWFPASDAYKSRRDLLIDRCLATGQPLVILEEEEKVAMLLTRLQNKSQGTVYLTPTLEEQSTPSYKGARVHELLPGRDLDPWGNLLGILEKAGTKHVSIGGRYLILEGVTEQTREMHRHLRDDLAVRKPSASEWLARGFITKGCVGGSVYPFLTFFDVSLSDVSSPNAYIEDAKTPTWRRVLRTIIPN